VLVLDVGDVDELIEGERLACGSFGRVQGKTYLKVFAAGVFIDDGQQVGGGFVLHEADVGVLDSPESEDGGEGGIELAHEIDSCLIHVYWDGGCAEKCGELVERAEQLAEDGKGCAVVAAVMELVNVVVEDESFDQKKKDEHPRVFKEEAQYIFTSVENHLERLR